MGDTYLECGEELRGRGIKGYYTCMHSVLYACMHTGDGGLRGTYPVHATHQAIQAASLLLWYYIQQVDSDYPIPA